MVPRAAGTGEIEGGIHAADASGGKVDRDTRAGDMEVERGNGADVEEVVDQMVTGIDLLYLILQSVFLRPLGV